MKSDEIVERLIREIPADEAHGIDAAMANRVFAPPEEGRERA